MEKRATTPALSIILLFVLLTLVVPIRGQRRPLELYLLFEVEAVRLSPSRSGMPTERRKMNMHQRVARRCCASTSGHRSTDPVKPMELELRCMCKPMEQKVNDTCAIVACTVAVEAVNRFVYEKRGEGSFPYRAAPPDDLFRACRADGTWKPREGADVRHVLEKIRNMNGVLRVTATTDAPTPAQPLPGLPLRSWREHSWDDGSAAAAGGGAGLITPELVADLLYNSGPCIGEVWVSGLYRHLEADRNDALVYTSGFGPRDSAWRRELEKRYPGQVGWHAVVCFGYRFRGGEMHVLVLDNHGPTGPRRWIHVKEFRKLYTLTV